MDTLHIVQANLDDPQHQAAALAMLRSYAKDPMGNSRDLAQAVQDVLIDRLRQLKAVEDKARELDCCKLTLEVQENNRPALALSPTRVAHTPQHRDRLRI